MTTEDAAATRTGRPLAPPGRGARLCGVALPVLALVLGALAVRAVGLRSAFELWVDEVLYAQNTATRRSASTSRSAASPGATGSCGRRSPARSPTSRGTAVFAPLGVGRHVDHLLARAVGEHLGAVLYADFPYAVPGPRAEDVAASGWRPWAWAGGRAAGDRRLPHAGRRAVPGGEVPLRHETYYAPASRVTAAPSVAGRRRPSTAPAGRAPTSP